jgi:hypothetical protein
MTPREIIESFARGRSEMANKIRHMRKIVRSKPVDRDAFPIWKEIEWIKRLVYNPVGYGSIQVPVKPTLCNLYELAQSYHEAGRSPLPWEADPHWVNPLSTETYSACGHEDYLFDQREACREYAEELIDAVDYLLLQERFPVADLPKDLTIL